MKKKKPQPKIKQQNPTKYLCVRCFKKKYLNSVQLSFSSLKETIWIVCSLQKRPCWMIKRKNKVVRESCMRVLTVKASQKFLLSRIL